MLGLGRQFPGVGPANVRGIERNAYAAELARVTIWIGEIQWMVQNGYGIKRDPILQPLDQIENRNALINADGTEATWPAAQAVVANPPFLGDKKMMGEPGEAYVNRLRHAYRGRVPGSADLVCYWFEKYIQYCVKPHTEPGTEGRREANGCFGSPPVRSPFSEAQNGSTCAQDPGLATMR